MYVHMYTEVCVGWGMPLFLARQVAHEKSVHLLACQSSWWAVIYFEVNGSHKPSIGMSDVGKPHSPL